MSALRQRIAVGLLAVSAAGFSAWKVSEGYTDHSVIPTRIRLLAAVAADFGGKRANKYLWRGISFRFVQVA